jgi:hypothetical protein
MLKPRREYMVNAVRLPGAQDGVQDVDASVHIDRDRRCAVRSLRAADVVDQFLSQQEQTRQAATPPEPSRAASMKAIPASSAPAQTITTAGLAMKGRAA